MELNISVLFQLGLFIVLYGWLRFFLFKPLLKTLNSREEKIVGAAKLAHDLTASNAGLAQEIDDKMSAANAEARGVLTSLREEGLRVERTYVEQAREAAQSQIGAAKEDIQKMKSELTAQLDSESGALAQIVVRQVLGRGA